MMSKKAGVCVDGKAHLWGKEVTEGSGAFTARTRTPCKLCGTLKYIRYTAKGNHIEGYDHLIYND